MITPKKKNILKTIRNGQVQPERSSEYWSDAEREQLRRQYENGTGISEIALCLKRAESAIMQQLFVVGLLSNNTRRHRKAKLKQCICPECPLYPCGQEGC